MVITYTPELEIELFPEYASENDHRMHKKSGDLLPSGRETVGQSTRPAFFPKKSMG
jgi:hypothetical protein